MSRSPSSDVRSWSHPGFHRPIMAGMTEGPATGPVGASTSVLARVTDTSLGNWDSSASAGDWVRLMCRHATYDGANGFQTMCQPFTRYGGEGIEVGQLVGEAGSLDDLDIAARQINAADVYNHVGEYDEWTGSVYTGDFSNLVGENVVKTGARTGLTRGSEFSGSVGTVDSVTSSLIKVNIGTDQAPGSTSDEYWQFVGNGDSGCALWRESTMELIGATFSTYEVGTPNIGNWTRIDDVLNNFGVEIPSQSTFLSENSRTSHAVTTKTYVPSNGSIDVTVVGDGTSYGPFSLSGGVETTWMSGVTDAVEWELQFDLAGDGSDQPVVEYGSVFTNVATPSAPTAPSNLTLTEV